MEIQQTRPLQTLTKTALFANILSLIIFFFVYGEMSRILMGLIITLEVFAGALAIYNLVKKTDVKANRWVLFMSFVPWLFYLVFLIAIIILKPPLAP